MQREGAVPGSSVQNKMTRIASLDQDTKHLKLLFPTFADNKSFHHTA
jgi:hypothetical protein